jgi:hypothetical protein
LKYTTELSAFDITIQPANSHGSMQSGHTVFSWDPI